MEEREYIKKCLEQIETQLNWGPSATWHNDVFNELSELIEKRIHVLLSATTLKRVWGKVNYDNSPSISTLNALAVFAGYDNWRDFKTSGSKLSKPATPKRKNYRPVYMIGGLSMVVVLLISLFAMTDRSKRGWGTSKPENITFSSHPVTAGLPNSVVFNFDLAGIHSDSIYIQQFWDPTKTIRLTEDQSQATGIYYYPGYFRAKLIIDGTIVKEHDLFIKTSGWKSTVDYNPVPKYVTPIVSEGLLQLPSDVKVEIESSETPLYSTFHIVNDFGDVSGDDFTLTSSIRNTYHDKWAVCQRTQVYILGTKGAMVVPFAIPGCVSDLNLMLGDIYLSGKENDLSAFGADLSSFRKMEIQVKDKLVTVLMDGTEIYSKQYQESVGRLVGLRFKFLGVGEVKGIEVIDDKGEFVAMND